MEYVIYTLFLLTEAALKSNHSLMEFFYLQQNDLMTTNHGFVELKVVSGSNTTDPHISTTLHWV